MRLYCDKKEHNKSTNFESTLYLAIVFKLDISFELKEGVGT
jgi:hypothetical protein